MHDWREAPFQMFNSSEKWIPPRDRGKNSQQSAVQLHHVVNPGAKHPFRSFTAVKIKILHVIAVEILKSLPTPKCTR